MSDKRPRNYMTFRKPRTRAIRALNNICVINTIARNSLIDAKFQLETGTKTKLNYEIPTISGEQITVARRRFKILNLIKKTIDTDLFKQSIIAAVAITEDYLITTLKVILSWYPDKLASGDKKVDILLILDSDDLDELLDRLVEKKIHSALYEPPAKYLQFIENTLSVTIPQKHKEMYVEIKATRDILVHNGGVVNSSYLRKANKMARAKEGEDVPINPEYFNECIRCMKAIIASIYTRVLKKYGDV